MNNLAAYIKNALESNIFGEYSIAIYGGAYHYALEENTSIENLISILEVAIHDAKFFTPQCKPSVIAKNFCHLLLIDPMLIEAYLGIRFSSLDSQGV